MELGDHRGTMLDHPTKAQRDRMFHRMDIVGNGRLSIVQVAAAMTELWPSFDHREHNQVLQVALNTTQPRNARHAGTHGAAHKGER